MKRRWGLGILIFSMLLCVMILPVRADAADPTVTYISAVYTGEAIEIGGAIPRDKISVTASFSDNTTAEVTDFAMSTERVLTDGMNKVMIIYRGKVTEVYVLGKKPSSLYAVYNGEMLSVGNKVGAASLTVNLYYTDGSMEEIYDYRIVNPVITSSNSQKVQITYNNLQTEVYVYTQPAKTVSMLTAVYEGEGAPQGYAIPEKNLYVTALYTDGTSERIYNYRLIPPVVQELGENKMMVSFGGKTAEFTVKGVELAAESIEAVYRGGSVEVGDYVAAEDVTVTATFSDGTKSVVKDFEFSSDRIMMTGENTIIIHYGGQSTTINVNGIARSGASYSNAASFVVKNTKDSAKVQVALPKRVDKDAIVGKSLKPDRVESLLNRVEAEVLEYMAFDILLADETQDDIFPLTMRIELPSNYKVKESDKEKGIGTYLYYTPNRKTVLARVNLEPGADGVIDVALFRAGTYILVKEKEIVVDDAPDPDDDYL